MDRKITVTGANIVFFIFVVLFIIFQFVIVFLQLLLGEDFIERNMFPVLLVNQYILILVPVAFYSLIKGLKFKEVFRFNRLKFVPAIFIILAAVPAYYVANMFNVIVVYLLQFIGDIPKTPIPVPQNLTELIIGLFVIAISPAICEELLHRGLLLSAYEKRGSIKAIVITAIIFGFFHFDLTNLFGPIFLGLLIGYYVIRTNSILAGMLAHFLNNAFAEIMQFIFKEEVLSVSDLTITNVQLAASIGLGIIAGGILSFLLWGFIHSTKGCYQTKPPISSVKKDVFSVLSHWPIIVGLVIYMFFMVMFFIAIKIG